MGNKDIGLIAVFLTDENGGRRKIGDLAYRWRGTKDFDSQFRYDLADHSPLLPPAVADLTAIHKGGLPLLFEDILPDTWGRALISRSAGIPPNQVSSLRILSEIAKKGFEIIGAISFGSQTHPKATSSAGLNSLVGQTISAEEGLIQDAESLAGLARLTGSGGARPKFLHTDESGAWLIKPASREDFFDIIRGEHVCLGLAADFKIGAPESKVFCVKQNDRLRQVIKVARFDVTPTNGRCLQIPMKTFLGAATNTEGSYEDMLDVLKRHSVQPVTDCERLFRQLLLNIVVGNIDDHLKNFSMIRGQDGWRLSKAYDITPAAMENPAASMFQSIGIMRGDGGEIPGFEKLVAIGGLAGLSKSRVAAVLEELQALSLTILPRSEIAGMTESHAAQWQDFVCQRIALVSKLSMSLSHPRP